MWLHSYISLCTAIVTVTVFQCNCCTVHWAVPRLVVLERAYNSKASNKWTVWKGNIKKHIQLPAMAFNSRHGRSGVHMPVYVLLAYACVCPPCRCRVCRRAFMPVYVQLAYACVCPACILVYVRHASAASTISHHLSLWPLSERLSPHPLPTLPLFLQLLFTFNN